MKHFGKYCGICLMWVLLSEILCLVLAVSFAILRAEWIRWLSLICGLLAHILLMYSCAQKIAKEELAQYRLTAQRTSAALPVLLAVISALPLVLVYLLLCMNPDSKLMLNLFPLMQSPYVQIHRLLIGGTEPFSAIAAPRRIAMALPPLVTALSWYLSYQICYIPAAAAMDARRTSASRT